MWQMMFFKDTHTGKSFFSTNTLIFLANEEPFSHVALQRQAKYIPKFCLKSVAALLTFVSRTSKRHSLASHSEVAS